MNFKDFIILKQFTLIHSYKCLVPTILIVFVEINVNLVFNTIKLTYWLACLWELGKILSEIDTNFGLSIKKITIHGNSERKICIFCLNFNWWDLQSDVVRFEIKTICFLNSHEFFSDLTILKLKEIVFSPTLTVNGGDEEIEEKKKCWY